MTTVAEAVRLHGASIMNGHTMIGVVAQNDLGLPSAYYLQVPRPLAAAPRSEKFEGDQATLYAETVAHNAQNYNDWCTAKGVSAQVRDVLRPLALAIRGACVVYGAIGDEHLDVSAHAAPALDAQSIKALEIPCSLAAAFLVTRAVNYVNTNHCTTGSRLPSSQMKLIQQVAKHEFADDDASHVTTVIYWATHVVESSWGIVNAMGFPCDSHHKAVAGSIKPPSAGVDEWLKLRIKPMPATTHALAVYAAMIRYFRRMGLAAVCPGVSLAAAAETERVAIMQSPMLYHPGASRYRANKRAVRLDTSAYKEAIGEMGRGLTEISPSHTLLRSPMVGQLVRSATVTPFVSICTATMGKIKPGDLDAVITSLTQNGSLRVSTFDPTDATASAAAIQRANQDVDALGF